MKKSLKENKRGRPVKSLTKNDDILHIRIQPHMKKLIKHIMNQYTGRKMSQSDIVQMCVRYFADKNNMLPNWMI